MEKEDLNGAFTTHIKCSNCQTFEDIMFWQLCEGGCFNEAHEKGQSLKCPACGECVQKDDCEEIEAH